MYEITEVAAKKTDNKSKNASTEDANKTKKSDEEKMNEALRDVKISWILKYVK